MNRRGSRTALTAAFPLREESGLLFLRQLGERSAGGEELRVKVFRRLEDGSPLFLETWVLLAEARRGEEEAAPDQLSVAREDKRDIAPRTAHRGVRT